MAPTLDDLLGSYRDAIDRRAALDWPSRDRALATFDVAKSDHATRGQDPLAEGLATVARRFDLDPTDTRILAVAAASATDPVLHLLSGLLSGDDNAGSPTVALALELAAIPSMSAEAALRMSDVAPLRRHRLITVDGSGPLHSRRVRTLDRVAAQLLGDDTPPASILRYLATPAPIGGPEADLIAVALRAGRPLVWVHNPPGGAGTALAAGACRQVGVRCRLVDLNRGPRSPGEPAPDPEKMRTLVGDLMLEAGLAGAVLILAGAEHAVPAADLLQNAALPVVAVAAVPWDRLWADRVPPTVLAPRLGIEQRATLWAPLFDGREPDRDITALRLTPEEINTVSAIARDDADLAGTPGGPEGAPVTAGQIRQAVRRLSHHRSGRAGASGPIATLDDLVLQEHVANEFRRLISWIRHRDQLLSQPILQGKGGKGTGICALFSGSPGTGKTLAAHIIADTLGMELYAVELSTMVDKYIGETEKNLERAFVEAESLNAVLFFDEADALFGSRSEVRDAHDRYANQEVAYLLQRMEQFDGVTILATNLRGNLDAAFARRLHFLITFTDPDAPTRHRLWQRHLDQLSATDPADPIDIERLSDDLEIAGGDIRNVVLAASYAAAEDGCPVGMRHVLPAVAQEFAKLGRRLPVRQYLAQAGRGTIRTTNEES